MSEVIKLRPYINGEYVESKTEKYLDAYDPSTGEVVAKVPCCTKEEVEMAIAAAKAIAKFAEKRGINPENIIATMDETGDRKSVV